jgi:hypothetical protein
VRATLPAGAAPRSCDFLPLRDLPVLLGIGLLCVVRSSCDPGLMSALFGRAAKAAKYDDLA